ncbi:MAG: O-antigen ligase family protein [Fimbriimonadaceae bacterium]
MATTTARSARSKRLLPAWLWPSAKDPGIEHINLVRMGLGLVFLYLAMMFLPDTVYAHARFVIHPLGVLWAGLAMTKMPRRFRFAFPFMLLLLLQVWMVVSMLYAEQFIPKPVTTGLYLWYPVEVGMAYLVTLTLGALMPGAMRYVINWLLVLCALSASVALLQAAHIGPAIRIADYYVYRSIDNWDNISGIRASGLNSESNANLLVLLLGAALIMYKSTKRSLRPIEWAMWGMFIVASFAGQHRSSMPLVGLTFIVTLAVMLRKRPAAFYGVLAASAALFLLAFTVGRDNFAYTFETTWSTQTPELKWRIDESEHAYAVFLHHPITGIGPSPAPEMYGPNTGEFDFNVENLYFSLLLTVGIPGLIIVLTLYIGALAICLAHYANRRLTYPVRVMALAGALAAFNLLWNGLVRVNLGAMHNIFAYMALMAIVQITITESGTIRRRTRVSPLLQNRKPTGSLVQY